MYTEILENFFYNFGIIVKVENILIGSVVETYELKLISTALISKIVKLQDNLTMELGMPIRIIAPIPNKQTIGIEIPLEHRQIIDFESYVSHLEDYNIINDNVFNDNLNFILGEDPYGNLRIENLINFPHLLIAGTTGSGKSNLINSIICSLLISKYSSSRIRFILIDPKRVELTCYNKLVQLWKPIVTESHEALQVLKLAIVEMEVRYKEMAEDGFKEVNKVWRKQTLQERIVIIVDELADLMLSPQAKEIEICLQRIAQLGRAAGLHLIIATQRPTVNVITGKIKTNLTTRISLKMVQEIDSRTILNCKGAETLLGKGDMLFQSSKLERLHGAFISEQTIARIVIAARKNIESIKQYVFKNDRIRHTKENLKKEFQLSNEEYDNLDIQDTINTCNIINGFK